MPELPEVETIARVLRPELTGRTIQSAHVLWKRTVVMPSPAEFIEQVGGLTINGVSRRAKYLDIQLADLHLLIHLRMSGDLYLCALPYQTQAHDRLVLELSDGQALVFNDTRKFGRVWLTADAEQVLGNLGPEPLEATFTAQELYARLRQHGRQLKPLLLDQSFLAGLGNIYTDEALHLAGLHPLRISDTITEEEATRLYDAIRAVLLAGIEHNGASIDWVYRGGSFQNYFRVYAREGQPCPVCSTPVQRLVVGQRGTHICPQCQVK
ncbi:MAG: DNA-formamidopyrimidine glycosylase [Anaerolineae bacterium]|nr:MAG: DNA-formamidopyrimidine glycosylase [Anaerolineae bacterium]